MAETGDDFWTLPGMPFIETPKDIMTVQAGLLDKHTNRMLVASVATKAVGNTIAGNTIRVSFNIYVPGIQPGYEVELFYASHDLTIYPAEIGGIITNSTITCANAEDFKRELRRLLSSDRTQNIISSLLNLARS